MKRIFLILLSGIMTIVSCSGNLNEDKKDFIRKVSLSSENLTLTEGERFELSALFEGPGTAGFGYKWTSDNPAVVALVATGKFSVVSLTALSEGSATVSFSCTNDAYSYLSSSVKVTVNKDTDKVLQILAIGNSFSEDAVEQNLWELFNASGRNVVIGNMYIGGCTLEKHWSNIQNKTASYAFREVIGGTKTNTTGKTLEEVLTSRDWDVISLQQQSGSSGKFETYEPYLTNIIKYVKEKCPSAKLMFHQTWAYAQNSTHSEFGKYDRDQMTMYEAIVTASKKIDEEYADVSKVIPSGTAVQNARTSYMGDNFCRDGYHMNREHGRYLVACTWFEALTGESVIGNSYTPLKLKDSGGNDTDAEDSILTELCQTAAHLAVQCPYAVTDMIDFKEKTMSK